MCSRCNWSIEKYFKVSKLWNCQTWQNRGFIQHVHPAVEYTHFPTRSTNTIKPLSSANKLMLTCHQSTTFCCKFHYVISIIYYCLCSKALPHIFQFSTTGLRLLCGGGWRLIQISTTKTRLLRSQWTAMELLPFHVPLQTRILISFQM